jgi:hypothetical protein
MVAALSMHFKLCSTGNQELLSDRVAQTTSSFLNVPMPIIDQQQLHLNNHHEHGN